MTTIEIRQNSAIGPRSLLVDGTDISRMVRSVSVDLCAGGPTEVRVGLASPALSQIYINGAALVVGEVEMPAALKRALLQALIDSDPTMAQAMLKRHLVPRPIIPQPD